MSQKLIVEIMVDGTKVASKNFSSFPVVFGRGTNCHMALPDLDHLSRNHGVITVEGGQIRVDDLGSTNGIFQNSERTQRLEFGSKGLFNVGKIEFHLNLLEDKEQPHVGPTLTPVHQPKNKAYIKGHLDHMDLLHHQSDPDLKNCPRDEVSLQGLITWGDDVYDVRTFIPGDTLEIGPNIYEPVFLPVLLESLRFGDFSSRGAHLTIPKSLTWELFREERQIPLDTLKLKRQIGESNKHFLLNLALNEVCSIDLNHNLKLYFRYVREPRPLISRTWIENREEFKKAITISGMVHLAVTLLALFSTPKINAPKIEGVPQRFAKLIVDPPKQILAAKPPPPPPPPPPPVEEKVEPQKEEIPVVKTPKVKPRAMVKKEMIAKNNRQVKSAQKLPPSVAPETRRPIETSIPPAKAQPTAEQIAQQEAQQMMSLLGDMPSASSNAKPIKISKNQRNLPSAAGVTSALNGKLDAKQLDTAPGTLAIGSEAGKVGFAGPGVNGKAGKRKVTGGVIGAPSFTAASSPQGLSPAQVMKVVSGHLASVQRCYERALFDNSDLVGRVEYEWDISPRGNVEGVRVKRSDLSGADMLNSCVMALFKKMKFPQAKNGESTLANIGFPFGR